MSAQNFGFEQIEEVAASAWASHGDSPLSRWSQRMAEFVDKRPTHWQRQFPAPDDPQPGEVLRGISRRLAGVEARLVTLHRQLRVPLRIPFASELSVVPGLIVMRPIPVLVEADEGEVAIRWVETGLAGFGENEREALDDLRAEIVEVYEDLAAADLESMGAAVRVIREVVLAYVGPIEGIQR